MRLNPYVVKEDADNPAGVTLAYVVDSRTGAKVSAGMDYEHAEGYADLLWDRELDDQAREFLAEFDDDEEES